MRNKSWFYLASLICLAHVTTDALGGTTQKVRSLTVKVIDFRTKHALEGITVHYIVIKGTYRTSTLGVLPPIEPLVGYTIVSKKSADTNANGEAIFEGVEGYFKSYFAWPRIEKIHSEEIFINLEPTEVARQRLSVEGEKNDHYELLSRQLPELKYIMNPNPKYKGYVLTTVDIREPHGREQEGATFEFRPEVLIVRQKHISW